MASTHTKFTGAPWLPGCSQIETGHPDTLAAGLKMTKAAG
jgi:hypothetical protein